ncbi:MAG: GDP-mannose 4,6-dehydratase, partial [Flavobacteriales bacterium]|nr:GDP-mannose 4,6-dehydratase [Flavobacteriales bacterium]
MKRVLVTGGAGFIGSHLCKRLLDKGCDVICLDNYFSGSKNNVVELMSNPNFDVIRHDVVDPYTAEVDEIYNLACPASPIHYQFNPVKTTRTSVLGTINMLELARRKGAKMFQASTSEIYGDPHEAPQKEDYWGNVDPIGVRACYEEGKRCAETLCFGYHRQKEVEIKVARIFNTYGPNMNPADGSVM